MAYTTLWDITNTDTKNAFIFEELTGFSNVTGYIPINLGYIKLRMSSFNYFQETQLYKVLFRAEDEKSKYAFKIIEFYVATPPKTKLLYSNSTENFQNNTLSSWVTLDTVNTTSTASVPGWSDNG